MSAALGVGVGGILPGSLAAYAKALGLRRGFLMITPPPVLLGALASAWTLGRVPDLGAVAAALAGALLIHAGTNLANEYWDHVSGTDDANLHRTPFSGGTRAIQEGLVDPGAVHRAAGLFFLAGLVVFAVLDRRGAPGLLPLALAGAAAGYFYTAPPLALAYRGLGELAVGLNFGPMLAASGSLAAGGTVVPAALVGGGLLMLGSVAVLLVNEVPDVTADRGAGKLHLVVRLGEPVGMELAKLSLRLFHPILVLAVMAGALPPEALLGLLAWPGTRAACRAIGEGLDAALARPPSDPARYAPFEPACRATIRAKLAAALGLLAGLFLASLRGAS